MEDEAKVWIVFFAGVFVTGILLIGMVMSNERVIHLEAFEAGYCQTLLPGRTRSVWQKCPCP